MIDTIKSINKPLQGSLKPVEPKSTEDNDNTIRIVFGTMEKDGEIYSSLYLLLFILLPYSYKICYCP